MAVVRENWNEDGRTLRVGDEVWPGMALVSMPDLSQVRIRAALPDVDDGRVTTGMGATAIPDAYPHRRFSGKVTEIAPVARETERSLRRSFRIKIALDHAGTEILRPRMSVRVEIDLPPLPGVLLVPRAALDLRADPAKVTLADGRNLPVSLGACGPAACSVTGGIDEGATVKWGAR